MSFERKYLLTILTVVLAAIVLWLSSILMSVPHVIVMLFGIMIMATTFVVGPTVIWFLWRKEQ